MFDIGAKHNDLLEAYYKNAAAHNVSVNALDAESFSSVKAKLEAILRESNPELFTTEAENGLSTMSALSIAQELSSNSAPTNPYQRFDMILDYLDKSKKISSQLVNELKNINEKSKIGVEVLGLVNDMSKQTWSGSDTLAVRAFTQVFKSSSEYWHKPSVITTTSKYKNYQVDDSGDSAGNDCNDAIIIADCAGGLIGALGGPASALLWGAAASITANHMPPCAPPPPPGTLS